MWYLVNFYILSQSLAIFHVSLSTIYLLFLSYRVLYMRFFLNICEGFSLWQFSFNVLSIWKNLFHKKGLVVEISLGLIYIFPYYLYSAHVIHYFYLTIINFYLFINICNIPIKFMINKEKTFLSGD